MSDTSDTLEQHEHAEHAAAGGRRYSALLIAVLAAGLAFAEQGAQHAQTEMSAKAIAAADLWAQYQAKSIRANEARDLAAVLTVTGPAGPTRDAVVTQLRADANRFENDGSTGKAAIANQAKALEAARDAAHERLESFDYAAAAFQLGIVLTTASVITRSRMLVTGAALLGVVGATLGVLGLIRPDWAGW
jgi:hypothetical protein